MGVSNRANRRHAELLSLGADSALTIVKARDIEDGARHYRYQQTYRGIPVYGAQIVLSENANGQVRAIFGRQGPGLAAEVPRVPPRVTDARAPAPAKPPPARHRPLAHA